MPFPLAIVLAAQTPFALQPCPLPAIDGTARCGTYWVYEDRARGAGRKIPLKVIILPARRPPSAPDPMLVVSPGGPGTTNSETGVALASVAAWRDSRDVVLVDLRGTSGPNRLDCRMPGSDDHPEGYLATLFPTAAIRTCRDALSKRADLRLYNTMLAVDDVDEVRAALGYEKVNLWGASWGTRAVLIYLRRHPEAVRSAIIEGVAPVSFKNPLPHARSAQGAIDSLFRECERQAACHAAFPDPSRELAAVVERLKQRPADVTIPDSAAGAPITARLTWQQFAEALRVMTYNLATARRVPMVVHQAYPRRPHILRANRHRLESRAPQDPASRLPALRDVYRGRTAHRPRRNRARNRRDIPGRLACAGADRRMCGVAARTAAPRLRGPGALRRPRLPSLGQRRSGRAVVFCGRRRAISVTQHPRHRPRRARADRSVYRLDGARVPRCGIPRRSRHELRGDDGAPSLRHEGFDLLNATLHQAGRSNSCRIRSASIRN
ncbi:MAG TPA: alpha/beta fold hydrolase [Gemmatimonadales bacterium]|nr:alpha/beta fold hydrolase [Gemmatimonadales bacterium]